MRGSNITSVAIGAYTPLQYIGYSDLTTEIVLENLPVLETIELGDTSLVNNLTIINSNNINQFNILNLFLNKQLTVNLDNLIITEVEAVSGQFMDWLVGINANITGGNIYVQGLDETILEPYKEKWPKVQFHLYKIYADEVIFGVSGEGE